MIMRCFFQLLSLLLLAGRAFSFNHGSWTRQFRAERAAGAASALLNSPASNFALDPKATEEEWMRRASSVDRAVFKLTEEGMQLMKKLNLEDASAAFDEVFKLKPNAYLWQAGIVSFYLDEFEKAANLFAKNAAVYESKFGGRASEERIWRHACELKMASLSKSSGQITKMDLDEIRAVLAPFPQRKEDPSLSAEPRKVVRIASDLFESTVDNDTGGVILSRAKLRSIAGNFDDLSKLDLKQWKLHSWFFLGLHYDALGEVLESKECMQMAFQKTLKSGNGDDIVHVLPIMHLIQRNWFDDDAKDTDPLELLRVSKPKTTIYNTPKEEEKPVKELVDADPLVYDSIWKSVDKMTLPEVEYALELRGIHAVGEKAELKEQLFQSLMIDSGLTP